MKKQKKKKENRNRNFNNQELKYTFRVRQGIFEDWAYALWLGDKHKFTQERRFRTRQEAMRAARRKCRHLNGRLKINLARRRNQDGSS